MAEIGGPSGVSQGMFDSFKSNYDAFVGVIDAKINDALDKLGPLVSSALLSRRRFTVQDGGADPLFSYDATNLPYGTIVTCADLGGCGVDAAPGIGLVVWMGEWRRLSRGVTKTYTAGVITLDTYKDPMRIAFTGSLLTAARALIARPHLGAKWSFVRPGLGSVTTALGVNALGGLAGSDIALVGPAVNFIEYTGSTLTQVSAE